MAPEDPLKSLDQTIFNLGNKHPTLSREEDVKLTADLVLAEPQSNSERLTKTIASW